MSVELGVIVPVYNEAGNVRPIIKRLSQALRNAKIAFHIYVVDDRSTDATAEKVQALQAHFPVTLLSKKGKQGKAYSILEAAQTIDAPYLAMIDADLQYSPEAVPEMFRLTQQYGVIVARRKENHESWFRKVTSRGFQWFFGKVLHGLECDVQSGLKVFKKEIIDHVPESDVTPWTLDIPLLTTALRLGYTIGEIDIVFAKRTSGESKIKLLTSIKEIGGQAITYKLKRKNPFKISPEDASGMKGAGLIKGGRRFVTHTTLGHSYSAIDVFTRPQKLFFLSIILATAVFAILNGFLAAKIVVGFLSFIYFMDVFFNLFVILKSLHQPPEISIPDKDVTKLKDKDLPTYTVLCPLYKEAHVLPHFLAAIEKLDWPKNKLDVILLLEADDIATIKAAEKMDLPKYVSIQVVPDSQPKTKPKACNYGLHFAKGEFLVIFDAEDSPDPLQLKKVFLAFQQSPAEVKCIQAKLNFYNPHQNLLTRFFTAEYSLWFDVVLTGLQSIQTTIPLGGTSNHFRTQELKELEGWDPFNVTEDADLGVRLFKRGALTAIIDSVTLEEANSNWHNWLRQRSRWIKGYMQTYLVHMRHPLRFFREYGWHALLFQLVVGGKISFMLINPLMWLLTITYFGLYAWVGPAIESLYPSIVFYMAVTSLLFGNFFFLYYYMIGAARRGHWSVIKWVLLVPIYWLMVSISAFIALYQLIVKPHYWEKTIHGLHLKKQEIEEKVEELAKDVSAQAITMAEQMPITTPEVTQPLPDLPSVPAVTVKPRRFAVIRAQLEKISLAKVIQTLKKPQFLASLFFIAATLGANVLNLVTNFYLGKTLNFTDFGLFNLLMSLFYLSSIPIQALGSTVMYKAGYLLGKHNLKSLSHFLEYLHWRVVILSLPITIAWLILTPWLPRIFNSPEWLPFAAFGAVWIAHLSFSVNSAYLTARLLFFQIAILTLVQPLVRLVSAVVLSNLAPSYTFVSVILALYLVSAIAYVLARRKKDSFNELREFHLPRDYYAAALVTGLSTIAFFSLDNLMVAHLMSAEAAGQYAFMGLFGKMVFFIGSLSSTFLAPVVARREGEKAKTTHIFYLTLLSVLLMTLVGFGAFILAPQWWGPIIFGDKVAAIMPYLFIYGIGISAFTLAQVIINYHLVKKHYLFPVTALALSLIQVIGLTLFHQNLHQVSQVMMVVGLLYLVIFSFFHTHYNYLKIPLQNVQDFFGLFQNVFRGRSQALNSNKLRILIFNWRDTKHVWAGGAEVYTHEIAKGLVAQGHKVTVFCGNDGHSPRTETVDGVYVIRRGGFYTVYVWAFLYYVTRLRGAFDLVIDCENGIPFLTPLYTQLPVYLLIHHIHQDVFREHLRFPLRQIAMFIEGWLMPIVYRHKQIITVSESSKTAISKLPVGFTQTVKVINPGVVTIPLKKSVKKTKHPSICYVGRLKPYKKVDTAIYAFQEVVKTFPLATFTIAGNGEASGELKGLVTQLGLEKNVSFVGAVSDQEKAKIFAESWLSVQPSMIEGWGITVIEANSYGTPVIASNVPGLRDSIVHNQTGLLVSQANPQAFAESMVELLKNTKKRTTLSKNAQKWAQDFTWTKSTNEFLNFVYQTADFHIAAGLYSGYQSKAI